MQLRARRAVAAGCRDPRAWDRDETDRVRFYQGSIEDITQRRQVQEELAKLSRAVDRAPPPSSSPIRGQYRVVNRKFVEITRLHGRRGAGPETEL